VISQNLAKIRARIEKAAQIVGRDPSEITLIAVAKGQKAEKILEVLDAGQEDIGENYAQEMLQHVGATHPLPIRWHFIGHLQKNKVKKIIDKMTMIQSVDSFEIAKEIDRQSTAIGKIQPILIEVNLGGEKSKSGINPMEVSSIIDKIKMLDHLDLQGLMTLPPYNPDPETVRPFFREMREIRDAINLKRIYKHPLKELSMGMTHDFDVAIEEGATIIRIGTGIFGEREK